MKAAGRGLKNLHSTEANLLVNTMPGWYLRWGVPLVIVAFLASLYLVNQTVTVSHELRVAASLRDSTLLIHSSPAYYHPLLEEGKLIRYRNNWYKINKVAAREKALQLRLEPSIPAQAWGENVELTLYGRLALWDILAASWYNRSPGG